MHIVTTRNRKSPCHLLRQSYWEDGKPKKRTLANLSKLPEIVVEQLQILLKNKESLLETTIIDKSLSGTVPLKHGSVSAILGMVEKLGLDKMLFYKANRQRSLSVAMLVMRLLKPGSKRGVGVELGEHGVTTLKSLLNLKQVKPRELYEAMDWLVDRQSDIEAKLAKKHLSDNLVLYDLTSTALSGEKCELGKIGYARDGSPDCVQINYGLLCNNEGCPIAIEVFPGDTADPMTVKAQIEKIKNKFKLNNITIVGDRGMITNTRIEDCLKINNVDWISALRHPSIKKLVNQKIIQPGLFDSQNLAEVESPDYPGERLIVCHNPLIAAKNKHTRDNIIKDLEADIDHCAKLYQAGKLNRDQLNRRLGGLKRRQAAKYLTYEFNETEFSYHRNQTINNEANLDGLYVIRTSLTEQTMTAKTVVLTYKSLAKVERAFRSIKAMTLKVRPVFHFKDKRVRSHIFICMLAYYIEWHMRQSLKPLLFVDEDPVNKTDPISPTKRSDQAKRKDAIKKTSNNLPIQSFPDLLDSLSSMTVSALKHPQIKNHTFLLLMISHLYNRGYSLYLTYLLIRPHW